MAQIKCDFNSEVLGYSISINVILPEPFLENNDKYPVVYLYHGMSDNETSWIRYTSIERYAREYCIAVVMPSVQLSYYTNMNKGLNYFDYVSKEVPKISKALFPITNDPKKTYLAGNSMGGYGAFKVALTNPDNYAAAASFSGALNIAEIKKRVPEDKYHFYENIFGDIDKIHGTKNDLLYLCEKLKETNKECPKLYQWCGIEDYLYKNNQIFKNKAQELGLPLTYEESSGDHQWKYWDICIQNYFKWIRE